MYFTVLQITAFYITKVKLTSEYMTETQLYVLYTYIVDIKFGHTTHNKYIVLYYTYLKCT